MYVADKSVHGLDVWTKDGKITIDENTSQKNLKKLFDMNYKGITKEAKKATPEAE